MVQVMISSYPSKGSLAGKKTEEMRLLNQSQCYTLAKMPDDAFHAEVVEAMKKLGIPDASVSDLWRVLSALLMLGNCTFAQNDDDKADRNI